MENSFIEPNKHGGLYGNFFKVSEGEKRGEIFQKTEGQSYYSR